MTRRLITPTRKACTTVLLVIVCSIVAAAGIVAVLAVVGVDRLVGGGPALS